MLKTGPRGHNFSPAVMHLAPFTISKTLAKTVSPVILRARVSFLFKGQSYLAYLARAAFYTSVSGVIGANELTASLT